MIGILDYGMANLRSVQNAFARVGHPAEVIASAEQVKRCDRLVLPGVGAFKDAMATLRRGGLDAAIVEHVDAGRPFLGICLGLQMLFDVSFEDGEWAGLGVLKGECVRFNVDRDATAELTNVTAADATRLKVPHMGWNQLKVRRDSPLTRGLADGSNVYFVHGYHVVPRDDSVVATTTDYGRPFVSSVWRDNVVATQFHPEKSQAVGLKLVENFATM